MPRATKFTVRGNELKKQNIEIRNELNATRSRGCCRMSIIIFAHCFFCFLGLNFVSRMEFRSGTAHDDDANRTVSPRCSYFFVYVIHFYGAYVRIPCTAFIWRRAGTRMNRSQRYVSLRRWKRKRRTLAIAIALFLEYTLSAWLLYWLVFFGILIFTSYIIL